MNPTTPDISVILVSWNRRADLEAALESLSAQRGVSLEIVVADNGSEDGTLEMLAARTYPIQVIANSRNLGACGGKNQGILAARSEFIAFMDSDAVLLHPDGLHDLVQRLEEDPQLGAVSGPIYSDREHRNPWVFGIHLTEDLYIEWEKTRTLFGEADALSTCFMVMRRKAALEVGGFDPVYFYQHEDLDFFLRLKKLGYRFEAHPGYPVWHRISQTGRKVGRMFFLHFREEWRHQYLLIKMKGVRKAVQFFARNLVDSSGMRAYYVRPISKKKFFALFVLLPIIMLAISPWIMMQRKKNHLEALAKKTSLSGTKTT